MSSTDNRSINCHNLIEEKFGKTQELEGICTQGSAILLLDPFMSKINIDRNENGDVRMFIVAVFVVENKATQMAIKRRMDK